MTIILPENYNKVSIVAIDPGLSKTGIAHYLIDDKDRNILSLDAFTINTDKLIDNTLLDPRIHSDRTIRLIKLREAIKSYLLTINPQVVVCESPFYNMHRPMAYRALVEVIWSIHTAVIEIDGNIMFLAIEPLLVKKSVGFFERNKIVKVKGKEIKDLIKQCIIGIETINRFVIDRIDSMDEHSVDAIAVGYTYLKLIEQGT